jgi:hypothetical protein
MSVNDPSKTIGQFCATERMSRAKYFKDRAKGRGPREMRDGRWVRISPEAHAEWRREREREQVANSTDPP